VRTPESARSRPTIDNIMLIAVVACLVIAVARLAVVITVVPYAVYVDRRENAMAQAAGRPEPRVSVMQRIERSPAASWWARKAPFREGGDYFGVLSRHATIRSLGCVIGVTLERERLGGARVERVLVPSDEKALYGVEPGTPMVRTDGTVFRSTWAPVGRYVTYFTDVPVEEAEYDPFLDPAENAGLEARTELDERARAFLVGAPVANGSGTWVLLARQGQGAGEAREFILVPVESAPSGVPR
jgi:hypothetical protein